MPRRCRNTQSRPLRFEPLESRRLLSITVDTLVDENNGIGAGAGTSLREAIAAAAPGETIDFSVTGTINLTVGSLNSNKQLTINKNLIIHGPGASLLTIKAFNPTPGANFAGDGSRVFTINDSNAGNLLDVSISGLTLTDGDVNTGGGGIWSTENLVVSDCVITNCTTTAGSFQQSGGGILSDAGQFATPNSLTLRNCILSGNTAPNTEGGAIRKRYGTLVIEDCTITGNSAYWAGGGVDAADGGVDVQINRSSISNNRTTYPPNNNFGYGGGIFTLGATITIASSTISGNSATKGGGIYTERGGVTLTDCIISNNSSTGTTISFGGAGVLSGNYAVSLTRCTVSGNAAGAGSSGGGVKAGLVTAIDSTISGNTASSGGGLYTTGGGAVINSTLSGNTATTSGGAILSRTNTLTITASTITANTSPTASQGAVRSSATRVYQSIISGNTNGDIIATVTSLGYNLIGTGSLTAFNQAGDQTGVTNPMLGPLADNGGPRKTHAPLAGSPAIDAGNPSFDPADPDGNPNTNDAMPYDERGAPFTRIYDGDGTGGARVDKGAVERQPISSTAMGDYDQNGVVDAGDYMVWRKMQGATGVTPYTSADGTGDGNVDAADHNLWRNHFGSTVPAAGAGASELAVGASESPTLAEPVASIKPVQAGSVFGAAGRASSGAQGKQLEALVNAGASLKGRGANVLNASENLDSRDDQALMACIDARQEERGSKDFAMYSGELLAVEKSDRCEALDAAFGEMTLIIV
jgi:predicted outer membrane repeat protein